jgi:hypothetical protein
LLSELTEIKSSATRYTGEISNDLENVAFISDTVRRARTDVLPGSPQTAWPPLGLALLYKESQGIQD